MCRRVAGFVSAQSSPFRSVRLATPAYSVLLSNQSSVDATSALWPAALTVPFKSRRVFSVALFVLVPRRHRVDQLLHPVHETSRPAAHSGGARYGDRQRS